MADDKQAMPKGQFPPPCLSDSVLSAMRETLAWHGYLVVEAAHVHEGFCQIPVPVRYRELGDANFVQSIQADLAQALGLQARQFMSFSVHKSEADELWSDDMHRASLIIIDPKAYQDARRYAAVLPSTLKEEVSNG